MSRDEAAADCRHRHERLSQRRDVTDTQRRGFADPRNPACDRWTRTRRRSRAGARPWHGFAASSTSPRTCAPARTERGAGAGDRAAGRPRRCRPRRTERLNRSEGAARPRRPRPRRPPEATRSVEDHVRPTADRSIPAIWSPGATPAGCAGEARGRGATGARDPPRCDRDDRRWLGG